MNDAPPNMAQTSLQDALELLAGSPLPTLPIVDPDTGRVLAVLARPEGNAPAGAAAIGWDGDSAGRLPTRRRFVGGRGLLGLVFDWRDLEPAGADGAGGGAWSGAGRVRAAALDWGMAGVRAGPACVSGCRRFRPGCRCRLCFCSLRLVPLSGTHAAEHQVVHCIEHHAPLVS